MRALSRMAKEKREVACQKQAILEGAAIANR
jgi:hypothetical protein